MVTLLASASFAGEWANFELRGYFDEALDRAKTFQGAVPMRGSDGFGYYPLEDYYLGRGETSYSLGLKRVVENNAGDLSIGVDIKGENGVYFAFQCQAVLDLGASEEAPTVLDPPRNMRNGQYPSRPLVVGHYYYLIAGGQHCLIHVLSLEGVNVRVSRQTKGIFGSTQYSTDGRGVFRYLAAESLEKLKEAMRPAPKFNTAQPGPAPSRPKPETPETGNNAGKTASDKDDKSRKALESSDLAQVYQSWQSDKKAFMELPVDKAGLNACDALLNRAKELDAQIEVLLISLDSKLTSGQGQITALQTKVKEISNPQVKDRVETMINELTKQVSDFAADQKAWAARRESLQKSRSDLSEYRSVLDVVKKR